MPIDYHVHSNYSDGVPMWKMLEAVADLDGLDGIGFADHCNVSEREPMVENKFQWGFNVDATFDRRRQAIESFRDEFGFEILNGFEIDWDTRDEDNIRAFLSEAQPDYAIGSVHWLDGRNLQRHADFTDLSGHNRESLVDRYWEQVTAMIEADLFDIAGHLDVVAVNEPLHGLTTQDHREMVVDALQRSTTVPELNGSSLFAAYGQPHPSHDFLKLLLERDITFVLGTDAHTPRECRKRFTALQELVDEYDIPLHTFELLDHY